MNVEDLNRLWMDELNSWQKDYFPHLKKENEKTQEKVTQNEYFEKIFNPPTLKNGNYYLTNGLPIKLNPDEDVYIAFPFAGSNPYDIKEWDFKEGFLWKKLDINHTFLKKFAGLIYNETRGIVLKEGLCVANAVHNYAKYVIDYSKPDETLIKIIGDIINFKKPLFYQLDPKPLQPDNQKTETQKCFASVINVFTQNRDYSGKATHWDGADFLQMGQIIKKLLIKELKLCQVSGKVLNMNI